MAAQQAGRTPRGPAGPWRSLRSRLGLSCATRARAVSPAATAADRAASQHSAPSRPAKCGGRAGAACGEDGRGDAFSAALRSGRILDARRALGAASEGRARAESFDRSQIEQVHRVAERFQESLARAEGARAEGGGWSADHVSDALQVRSRLAQGVLEMHASMSFPGLSPLLAVVGLCEGDLSKGYKPNVERTQCLHEDGLESMWLVLQRRSMNGALEDSVAEVSVVDALDEEDGCVWVGISSAQDDATRIRGVAIPPPAEGVHRVGDSNTVFRIHPVGEPAGAKGPSGFRMSMHVSLRPAGSQLKLLSGMPSFAMRMLVRKKAQEFETHFRRHIETCVEIERRVLSSPRSEFYMHVRQRVEQPCAAPTSRGLPDDRMSTCSTSTPVSSDDSATLPPGPRRRVPAWLTLLGREGCGDPASPTSSESSAKSGGLVTAGWDQLSTQIPISWAD